MRLRSARGAANDPFLGRADGFAGALGLASRFLSATGVGERDARPNLLGSVPVAQARRANGLAALNARLTGAG